MFKTKGLFRFIYFSNLAFPIHIIDFYMWRAIKGIIFKNFFIGIIKGDILHKCTDDISANYAKALTEVSSYKFNPLPKTELMHSIKVAIKVAATLGKSEITVSAKDYEKEALALSERNFIVNSKPNELIVSW